jgi:hypothetical protein
MVNIKSALVGGFLDAPKGVLCIRIILSREGKQSVFRLTNYKFGLILDKPNNWLLPSQYQPKSKA